MELNDSLIELKYFRCLKCKQFLHPPVMHTGDCDNICVHCYEREAEQDQYKRNQEIEVIIKLLTVPCRYNNCPMQLPYDEIIQHELSCEFKTWKCSLFGRNCVWLGVKEDIVKHFDEYHRNYLKKSNDFQFDYSVKSNEKSVEDILLSMKDELFVLHVNNTIKNIYFVLTHVAENDVNFKYRIELIDYTQDFKIKQKTGRNINKFNTGAINLNEAINFDLKPFDQINSLKFLIEISGNYIQKSKLDYNVLSAFECPACENYMYTCIYQCMSGHSLCKFCYKNINKCPTCNESFEGCRNYSLQNISSNVYFPCHHRDNGCRVVLIGEKIELHDNYCSYQIIDCPKCGWRDISLNLVQHFKTKHGLQQINKITLTNDSNASEYVIIHKNIFNITSWEDPDDNTTNWLCTQVTGNDKFNFKYELTLDNENEKFIKTKSCYKYLPGSTFSENVLKFDKEFISKFSRVTIRVINIKK